MEQSIYELYMEQVNPQDTREIMQAEDTLTALLKLVDLVGAGQTPQQRVELVALVPVERLEERVNLLFGLHDLLNPNVQNVVLLILLIQRPIDSSHGTGLLTSRL